MYIKPAECQKLNQQNLIISRVAVDVSVSVSFNSDLYLCAFYALYSELLQSLKSIKLPTSLSLSFSFFLAHSTTKRQRESDENKTMLTRFAGSPEKRWYSTDWLYRTPRRHAMLPQRWVRELARGTVCGLKEQKVSIKRFLCWLSAENSENLWLRTVCVCC